MIIETKFNIGQSVVGVRSREHKRIVKCVTCSGAGMVNIAGEEFICPKCHGSSATPQGAGEYMSVSVESTVGCIECREILESHSYGSPTRQVKYMLAATGIGSGQLWDENRLFSSRDDAEEFCRVHNNSLLKNEEGAEECVSLYRDYVETENAE